MPAKAMARQSGPRIITLRADLAGGDALIVAVEDTGPSIEASDLPQLFEPFFTTKQDGLGMGLAICQTTVEAHGGRLTVQSAPGDGAAFRLEVPVIPRQT